LPFAKEPSGVDRSSRLSPRISDRYDDEIDTSDRFGPR
jgi:hypothetical protein